MEYTGCYYEPLANYLYNAGLRVSVVNAILIHEYSNSCIRRIKTDKKMPLKSPTMSWIVGSICQNIYLRKSFAKPLKSKIVSLLNTQK